MTLEEQQLQREAHKQKIADAWSRLAENADFIFVYERDLQLQFGLLNKSFRSEDGFNPHAAAQRDGQKDVLLYIHRRRLGGLALLDADESKPEVPKEAVSEFQGTPP